MNKPKVGPWRPPSGNGVLDRIAGLLAHDTAYIQRKPLAVGLLDEASIERGEHRAASHALRVGIWRMVNPATFLLVGSQRTPVDTVYRKTSAERFYVPDNRGRIHDRGVLISLMG